MVMAFRMMSDQLTSIALAGMPSMASLPPMVRLAMHCAMAGWAPDISSATPKPPSTPSRAITDFRSSFSVLTVTASTSLRDSSSRQSLRSVSTTLRAPARRATMAAMMPMGPAPVTSTSSPIRSNCCAV